jgi:hypothetical protein
VGAGDLDAARRGLDPADDVFNTCDELGDHPPYDRATHAAQVAAGGGWDTDTRNAARDVLASTARPGGMATTSS